MMPGSLVFELFQGRLLVQLLRQIRVTVIGRDRQDEERNPPFPVFDADNHLYETQDAFTRHLPAKYDGLFTYVQVNGRTKIAVDNVIIDYIPNPKFDVVARPGAFAEYFSGNNPEGKSLRELAGKPMRTGEEYRTAEPRLRLLEELGLDAALMFPTLASLLEVRLADDPDLTCTVIHAFNEWLYDEWTVNYRDRIFATPIGNPSIPERGVAELDWLLDRGAKVVLMRPSVKPARFGASLTAVGVAPCLAVPPTPCRGSRPGQGGRTET